MPPTHPFENHLSREKSPYLLQHAHNPVDWYPWGDEAFTKAKKEGKPIFLSIGYSTCHWCHVMAHESFEDPSIARMINQYFIPIKVDREERPDIDQIYMSYVTAMTGQGGWPLTVFLTPDKKPFYGGTYFPPYAKWGSTGFIDIMQSIHQAWQTDKEKIIQSSESLTEAIKKQNLKISLSQELNEKTLEGAFLQFSSLYDPRWGGFGTAPKFPSTHNLSFLLRYWKKNKDQKALDIVLFTLDQMAKGGICDQLGGGFHRYSTDQEWQIPHFEKMLYDQAMISRTYLEAYQLTKAERYAKVARETLDYVLRDLQHSQGAFYSAQDADSDEPEGNRQSSSEKQVSAHKKEGAFYLWRYDEIKKILDKQEVEIFMFYYGVDRNGNCRHDPQGEFTGKNVLFVDHSPEETASKFGLTVEQVKARLVESREKLFQIRLKRPRPHLDDKILTDWNGLMISSLAYAAAALNEPRYKEAAEKAVRFINAHLVDQKGRLSHRFRDGETAVLGNLDDYAFYIQGLLDLYESSLDVAYLKQARQLGAEMLKLFSDQERGGFYLTSEDAEGLLYRPKSIYDGAIPSGNSAAALDLVRFYHFTFDPLWDEALQRLLQAFSTDIAEQPAGYAQMLIALQFSLGPSQEIVIAGRVNTSEIKQFHQLLNKYFLPQKILIFNPREVNEARQVIQIAPFIEDQGMINDQTTVYICEDHVCRLPLTNAEALTQTLDKL